MGRAPGHLSRVRSTPDARRPSRCDAFRRGGGFRIGLELSLPLCHWRKAEYAGGLGAGPQRNRRALPASCLRPMAGSGDPWLVTRHPGHGSRVVGRRSVLCVGPVPSPRWYPESDKRKPQTRQARGARATAVTHPPLLHRPEDRRLMSVRPLRSQKKTRGSPKFRVMPNRYNRMMYMQLMKSESYDPFGGLGCDL